jgi:hypothetical protein
MVLARDETAAGSNFLDGLVYAAVPIRQFERVPTGGQRQNLIAEAHAEDR